MTATKKEFLCPVCLDSNEYSNARVAFAHLIWKHPQEYLMLKRASVERTEMVRKANYENVANILKSNSSAANCPSTASSCADIEQFPVDSQDSEQPHTSSHCTSLLTKILVKCNWCPFMSVNCEEMANHDLTVHACIPRYNCSNCRILFMRPFDLCIHFRTVHNQMVIFCTNCGEPFDDDATFCAHLQDDSRKFLISHYEKLQG